MSISQSDFQIPSRLISIHFMPQFVEKDFYLKAKHIFANQKIFHDCKIGKDTKQLLFDVEKLPPFIKEMFSFVNKKTMFLST